MGSVIRMSGSRSKVSSTEKKKDKPTVRKVMGNVKTWENTDEKKSGPPSYEHG